MHNLASNLHYFLNFKKKHAVWKQVKGNTFFDKGLAGVQCVNPYHLPAVPKLSHYY